MNVTSIAVLPSAAYPGDILIAVDHVDSPTRLHRRSPDYAARLTLRIARLVHADVLTCTPLASHLGPAWSVDRQWRQHRRN